MRRVLAVAGRILSQFRHDKRTVILMLVAPVLVLWLFSVLLADSYVPIIAVTDDVPKAYLDVLKEEDVQIVEVCASKAKDLIENRDVDAIIGMKKDKTTLDVLLEGGSRVRNGAVASVVQDSMKEMMAEMKENVPKSILGEKMVVQDSSVRYLHGKDSWDLFDYTGPVFIGIFIFVFTFLTSGMSLVNERAAGTMERFLATPIRPLEILGGYALGFGLFALVQVSVILSIALHLLNFPNEGSALVVVIVAVSLAIASVTFGLLVSGLAKTGFQVIQLMILFVVPQILLCGLFDLSACPIWLQNLSHLLPLRYGVDALTDVMLRGYGFQEILPNLMVIWIFIFGFIVAASFGLRKKRAK